MMTLPAATPVTTPLLLTVARFELLLLHVPPAVPSLLKLIVDPAHTVAGPLMLPADTAAFTVTIACAIGFPQPFAVYVIITLPAATPVTTPLLLTVARLVLLLLHDPPGVPLLIKFIGEPIHTDAGPLIEPAVTAGFTVTIACAIGLPQPFTV
jgi:hypothetical protein